MKKNENAKCPKISQVFCLHTQNPRRFPGFAVVVVTFFDQIPDDFHDVHGMCLFFQKKINNPFWGLTDFRREKTQFSLHVKQKHTFYKENQRFFC